MGDFSGTKWHPHLNEEARERRDEIRDHLEEKYENPSHFIREKLREEKALDIEERIRRKEMEKEQTEQDLKQLKQMKKDRNQRKELDEKEPVLKEKQEKLREVVSEDGMSREEAEKKVFAQLDDRAAFQDMGEEEIKQTNSFKSKVEELVSSHDVDQLVEEIIQLQERVQELNGGPEDYFMDLDQSDVEVQSV